MPRSPLFLTNALAAMATLTACAAGSAAEPATQPETDAPTVSAFPSGSTTAARA